VDVNEFEASDILGDLGRDAAKVVGPLAVLLIAPLILLLAAFGGLPEATRTTVASSLIEDIPSDQLDVMKQESQRTGISWQVFASIAKVESDFGRNMATSEAAAIGYGQFLPETWAQYGEGGDPYNFRDVVPAMGRLLLASGASADLPRAIHAYNHSWAYVAKVLAYAAAYGFVRPDSIPAVAVDLARSRMGAPYIWGATGPDAFDCSGLMLWVYGQIGIQMPRTAQRQFEWATPIELAQLQLGDLAFYENTYPSADRITHVGIYAGNGTLIMATSAGDFVSEVRLSDPYWSARLVGVGRPRYWEVPA
jgi:cell wall-associated NlpC family hydrolase